MLDDGRPDPVTIGFVAPHDCVSITMLGLFDVIGRADRAYGVLQGRPGEQTTFDPVLISLDGGPVRYRDRFTVQPDVAAPEVAGLDVVVVPGLDEDLDTSFSINRAWAPWLAQWHGGGTTVAASCSGTFLVAEAGLLTGRSATTHWLYAGELAARYPSLVVAEDRLLIDHGDVITSGGATTFLDLALYLVERFGGPERAKAAARMLLIDRGGRDSQLPYAVASGAQRNHRDPVLHRIQDAIDDELDTEVRIDDLAQRFGLSPRTLARRFQTELGMSAQAYLRARRIDRAKRLLETTDQGIDAVRTAVGYRDPTSFRRAFRADVGLTPNQYRQRYGWAPAAVPMR